MYRPRWTVPPLIRLIVDWRSRTHSGSGDASDGEPAEQAEPCPGGDPTDPNDIDNTSRASTSPDWRPTQSTLPELGVTAR